MDRQMFKKGGAAGFPDLSGDGKITQKDILMGRGVPMQMGGEPMAAQQAAMMPPGMPAASPAAGLPVPQDMPMEQAAMDAMQQGIDPAVLESMLAQASGSFGDLDAAAENEDYEQVINAIRGDQAPISERRDELASIVGEADAAQTPESVLTLVQPIMQIALVDQGIGSVAPDAMATPVEGDMAGGIMSTVNMAEEQPMAGQGGPAPVNFNQGGAVQYMQPGGVAMPNARQQELFEQQRALYRQLIDPAQQAADLEEQRNLSQAQMLFDIAQGGLMLATPGERNVSPISRFAEVFTPVLGNVGQRAAQLGEFEQAQKAEQRQLDLAALQGAQSLYSAERSAELSAGSGDIDNIYAIAVTEIGEDGQPVTRSLGQRPLTQRQYQDLIDQYGAENITIRQVPTSAATPQGAENFRMRDGSIETAVRGTQRYYDLIDLGGNLMGDVTVEDTKSDIQVFRGPGGNLVYYDLATQEGRDNAAGLPSSYVPINTPSLGDFSTNPDLRLYANRDDPTQMEEVDISTAAGRARRDELQELGYVVINTPSLSDLLPEEEEVAEANYQVFVDKNDPNNTVRIDISTAEGRAEAETLPPEFLPTNNPTFSDLQAQEEEGLGSSFNARFIELLSDPARITAYASGELDVTDPMMANRITTAITVATQARPVWDQNLGREVSMPATQLPQNILDAIEARREAGLSVPTVGGQAGGPQADAAPSDAEGRVRFNPDGTIDFSSFENDPTFIITGVDLTQSQDWTSTVNRFFNAIAGQLQPIVGGSGYSGEAGRITSTADTQLERLANQIMRVARADTEGRIFAIDADLLNREVSQFRPGGFRTDNDARNALVTTRNSLASMYSDVELVLMNPGQYDQNTVVSARTLKTQIERLLAETTAAVSIYDRFITGDPAGAAAADRAATAPTTSNLPRGSGN